MSYNVKSCKKFDEKAQTAKFTLILIWSDPEGEEEEKELCDEDENLLLAEQEGEGGQEEHDGKIWQQEGEGEGGQVIDNNYRRCGLCGELKHKKIHSETHQIDPWKCQSELWRMWPPTELRDQVVISHGKSPWWKWCWRGGVFILWEKIQRESKSSLPWNHCTQGRSSKWVQMRFVS